MTETTTPNPPSSSGPEPAPKSPARPRRPDFPRSILLLLGVAIALTGALAYVALRNHDQQSSLVQIRASGLPNRVPTPLSNLMGLSPVPDRPAPNFTLVDQNGQTLSLSSFRGDAVVLEFMDTHCTDICPIVSREFVDAYHDLGSSPGVVFVAVNVNQFHASVADVATFSSAHQLSSIRSWHFFTGSVAALQAAWRAYGVEVVAPSPNADIVHSSFVYFIDPRGHERYLADPTDDHTGNGAAYLPGGQLASWGRGIALVAGSLSR